MERQISVLNEEKKQLVNEINIHLNALQVSEVWHKDQKQELLDEIKKLKEEVEKLKKQLEQQNTQSTTQIEVKEPKKWPWKLKK